MPVPAGRPRHAAHRTGNRTHVHTHETAIIDSWQRNTAPWTAAVREGRIDSRRLVTDQAIVDAVMRRAPRSVLDLGCGEGWLTRRLGALGVAVVGVDAVAELVSAATAAGGGDFRVASYAQVVAGVLGRRFDLVVSNFALLGEQSVDDLVHGAPRLLRRRGALVVQTLHPLAACSDLPYRDGWREGSWTGFDPAFTDPAPWYFRTLETWIRLFDDSGLRLRAVHEPVHPHSGKPASVIFVAERA